MENLQKFQWTGIDRKGKRVKGTLEASDIKAAEMEIRAKDIEVISIAPDKQITFKLFPKKIKQKEIVLFTRFISTMLAAGMPIIQALDVIIRDQENELFKSVLISVRSNITSGMTFGDALNQYPKHFSDLYINLVRAGEKSGTLDKVLNRLAKYLEKIERLKTKLRNAMIYPVTIVAVAIVVSLILLIFVIPQFQQMFANANAKLPAFTRGVIDVSNFVRGYWWLLLVVIILGAYIFRKMKKNNPTFSEWVDKKILRIFIIGDVLKKAIIARFTRTLSITLDSGLPIVDSMRSMVNIMGNKIYSKAVLKISDDLASGHQLSSSMEETKLFPNMAIQMISVGEVSGSLAEMLNTVANYYEEEVDSIAENLSTLLEPLIIVILGVIVGIFVIAIYLPIFKLGTTI